MVEAEGRSLPRSLQRSLPLEKKAPPNPITLHLPYFANERTTGRITGCTAERSPVGSRGTLRCKLCSDRTEAYIHNLLPIPETFHLTSPNDDEISGEVENGFMSNNDCGYLGVGHPGSIPFVSQKPGAYGRLLSAVYVRWKGC